MTYRTAKTLPKPKTVNQLNNSEEKFLQQFFTPLLPSRFRTHFHDFPLRTRYSEHHDKARSLAQKTNVFGSSHPNACNLQLSAFSISHVALPEAKIGTNCEAAKAH
jgi:hypothetical protein